MLSRRILVGAWLIAGCGICSATAGEPSSVDPRPSAADVRTAIERALPYVDAGGVEWIEQRECISCHRVGYMVWSQTLAARRGFDVDRDKLREWTDWSLDSLLEPPDEGPGKIVADTNLEGISQMILSVEPEYRAERNGTYQQLLEVLQSKQSDDGTWKPGGQLPAQKRPAPETRQVTTMWHAIALGELADNDPPAKAMREKAMTAVEPATSSISTEWYAARTLLAHQSNDADALKRFREQLIASQHADGGWGWIQTDPSDALATGQALYALSQSGLASDHPAITAAWHYLITTQSDDGSWPVKGTKKKDKDNVVETATYWGAAWAVIGMVNSLPE